MSTAAAVTEIAWLFVRAEESVRLEVTRNAPGHRLDVWGPGRARASYEFAGAAAALSAAETHHKTLMEQGFALQARAERRVGRSLRPAAERRSR
jgi:hypothetical protein